MDALVSRLEVVTKKLEQVAQSGLPSSSYGISMLIAAKFLYVHK